MFNQCPEMLMVWMLGAWSISLGIKDNVVGVFSAYIWTQAAVLAYDACTAFV